MYRREGVLCVEGKEIYELEGRSAMCRREGVLCVEGKECCVGGKEYYV